MTTAIMRLTTEELQEFGMRWGMDEESVLESFEDGTFKAFLNQTDFIAAYTEARGSITDIVDAIANSPEMTAMMGSTGKTMIFLCGGIQLESGVVVVPTSNLKQANGGAF